MPASIPREGFDGRLAQLRAAHATKAAELALIEARIAESEYWLATITAIEAENNVEVQQVETPGQAKRQRTRKGINNGNGNS